MSDVIVIGAGVAGLAAAVELAGEGWRVRLLERRPVLGGRASSYRSPAGHVVDNGQHLLMGCYRRTFAFLERIGARGSVEMQPNLSVDFTDADGRTESLRCPGWPGPLHLAAGLLRYGHLTRPERFRLLLAGVAFSRLRGGDETIAEVLDRLGQGNRARIAFWDPLAIAVMNESPQRASAALFAEVLRRVFFSGEPASRLVFPRTGLSELYAEPAARMIGRLGGRVERGRPVSHLEQEGDRVTAVVAGDERIVARAFVLAVPPTVAAKLLPETLRVEGSLRGIDALEPAPIVSVHLWFAERLRTPRMLGLLDPDVHWLFTPPMQPERGRYVTLVSSGARSWVDRPATEVTELALSRLGRFAPSLARATVIDSLVTKERSATWAATPAEQRLRPKTETSIRNLFLAGDWIDTGLPATIESAVESGERAARGVFEFLRRPRWGESMFTETRRHEAA